MLREVLAPNASPMTLAGTRTYVIGRGWLAVIDPGSDDPAHLDAVSDLIGDGVLTAVLVTHSHPDHADGAGPLASRFHAPVRARRDATLKDGDRISTDAGDLVAYATPGHAPDHVALHWPDANAVFCGDLMMGGHDTTLVAPPEGRLEPYLFSLRRIRDLEPAVIHPAHGPSFHQPAEAIGRYIGHRLARLDQVERALTRSATLEGLVDAVYGDDLEPSLRNAATGALKAYLEHLQGLGRVRRVGREWRAAATP